MSGHNSAECFRNGWNCGNINIYVYDSSKIKIVWCNLTKDTIICLPDMWAPEVTLIKNRHERCFYLQGDTLTIDFDKTIGMDYGFHFAGGDSLTFGGGGRRVKKDSCFINIIDTKALFPNGLQGIKYFHLKDTSGDIYMKNQ